MTSAGNPFPTRGRAAGHAYRHLLPRDDLKSRVAAQCAGEQPLRVRIGEENAPAPRRPRTGRIPASDSSRRRFVHVGVAVAVKCSPA